MDERIIGALHNRKEKGKICGFFAHVVDLIGIWEDDTLKQILDYLESLTPEQIENQRAKNEAEKFNF